MVNRQDHRDNLEKWASSKYAVSELVASITIDPLDVAQLTALSVHKDKLYFFVSPAGWLYTYDGEEVERVWEQAALPTDHPKGWGGTMLSSIVYNDYVHFTGMLYYPELGMPNRGVVLRGKDGTWEDIMIEDEIGYETGEGCRFGVGPDGDLWDTFKDSTVCSSPDGKSWSKEFNINDELGITGDYNIGSPIAYGGNVWFVNYYHDELCYWDGAALTRVSFPGVPRNLSHHPLKGLLLVTRDDGSAVGFDGSDVAEIGLANPPIMANTVNYPDRKYGAGDENSKPLIHDQTGFGGFGRVHMHTGYQLPLLFESASRVVRETVKYRGEFYYGTHNQTDQHNYCELRRLDWGTRRLQYPPKGPYTVWDSKSISAGDSTPAILTQGYDVIQTSFITDTSGDVIYEVDISGEGDWYEIHRNSGVATGTLVDEKITAHYPRFRITFDTAATVTATINLLMGSD